MSLSLMLESMAEQDTCPIVICDTGHIIVYMNPAARERYAKYGGAALLGKSLLNCHPAPARERILQVLAWFSADRTHQRVHTYFHEAENKDVYMIALRDREGELIGYYEKHELRNRDMTPLYRLD